MYACRYGSRFASTTWSCSCSAPFCAGAPHVAWDLGAGFLLVGLLLINFPAPPFLRVGCDSKRSRRQEGPSECSAPMCSAQACLCIVLVVVLSPWLFPTEAASAGERPPPHGRRALACFHNLLARTHACGRAGLQEHGPTDVCVWAAPHAPFRFCCATWGT